MCLKFKKEKLFNVFYLFYLYLVFYIIQIYVEKYFKENKYFLYVNNVYVIVGKELD